MGGFESGSRGGGRLHVEACRFIDVNRMQQRGILTSGWSGVWQWMEGGEAVAWIGVRCEHDRIVLNYRYRGNGGEWQDVNEPVSIARVPCRFGGSRSYFICPGIVNGQCCGRREVVKLYGPGRYFLCCHCCRLAYASQSEDAMDRTRRRAAKIRIRLRGRGEVEFNPPKPKGMRQSTYERLCNKAMAADQDAEEAFEFLPKNASGTKWAPHQLGLQRVAMNVARSRNP